LELDRSRIAAYFNQRTCCGVRSIAFGADRITQHRLGLASTREPERVGRLETVFVTGDVAVGSANRVDDDFERTVLRELNVSQTDEEDRAGGSFKEVDFGNHREQFLASTRLRIHVAVETAATRHLRATAEA